MSYHSCKTWEPETASKGDTYRCVCGIEYVLTRTFPWKKWVRLPVNKSKPDERTIQVRDR